MYSTLPNLWYFKKEEREKNWKIVQPKNGNSDKSVKNSY